MRGHILTTKLDQIRPTWWKFDRYVLDRGNVVPAKGAQIRPASPWMDYHASRANFGQSREPEGESQRPPYLDLMELARVSQSYLEELVRTQHDDGRLPPEIEERLLAFCGTHGLLGLLHHKVVQLARPDSRRTWYREGGIWTLDDTSTIAGAVSCLVRARNQAILSYRFDDLWGDYFNTARLAPNPIPHPASQEFFEYYTESALGILFHAYGLRQAIEVEWAENKSLDGCNELMVGVSTQFRLENGQPVQEPVHASLLAAFADMAMRDAMSGLRLGRCECCGQLLVTNYERTKYCSVQCRWRVVKQRSRTKAAENKRKKTRRRK